MLKFSGLFLFLPLYLFAADGGQAIFVPNDPPPRAERGIEYESLPLRQLSSSPSALVFRVQGGRRLIGRAELCLSPQLPMPADSVRAVVQIIDESGDSLTVFEGRFDKDGRLEASFDGIYGTAAAVRLIGAPSDALSEVRLESIVLAGGERLMLIGDSITAGKFADDQIGFRKSLYNRLRAAGQTVDFVGDYGDPPYEGHFQGSMKINDFYPTGLTPNSRGRMDVTGAMNNWRPNIAVVHLGTNDLNSEIGFPVAPYAANGRFADTQTGELATLIDYLLQWSNGRRGTDLKAVVVSLIIPIKYEDSLLVAFNIEAARLVNDFRSGRITGRREPVYLADLFGRFREWPNLVENGYKALMADRLHPNTAGHELIAASLADVLLPLLSGNEKRFTDITWTAGIGGVDHVFEHQGIAVADIDGDGREELFISRTNVSFPPIKSLLFQQEDAPHFVDRSGELLNDVGAGRGAVFFDMDNDGDLDLFCGKSGSRNRLYENRGNVFVDVTQSAGIADFARITTAVLALDIDNDGDLDLYAVNSREKNELYINLGNGRFALEDRGVNDVSEPDVPSMGAAAADFDGDGDVDIYIVKRNGANKLFINNGGRFSEGAAAAGLALDGSSNSALFADLDNDGDLDLLIGRGRSKYEAAPKLLLFENRGDGTFKLMETALAMDGYSVLAEDFDNDGDLDLLITQENDYASFYRNDGGRFTFIEGSGAEIHAGDVRGAAALDFDDDGDLDVVAARADMFNVLLRNNLDNGNHFLKVKALGPGGSAVGFGTKLFLYQAGRLGESDGLIAFREVQSGGGHISQPSPVQHFGLAARTVVDLLAQFTDGSFTVLRGVAADQTIIVSPPSFAAEAPARLHYVSGDGLTGTVGEALSEPLVVRVTDEQGRPVGGVDVAFYVAEGDAELFVAGGAANRVAWSVEKGVLEGAARRTFDPQCADQGMVLIPTLQGNGRVRLEGSLPNGGRYALHLRLRSGSAPRTFNLKVDGREVTVSAPASTEWQWLKAGEFDLQAERHVVEIIFSAPLQLDQLLYCEPAYEPQGKEEISAPHLTDAQGEARRLVRFNSRAGKVTVGAELSRDGRLLPDSPIYFNLKALSGPAVSMHEDGGNGQSGRPNEPLAEPFTVAVLDVFGNPVPHFAVRFRVISGGGTLTGGETILTDENGRAQNTLILGSAWAQQVVQAEAPLSGSPILFYAFAIGAAQRARLLSGDGQSAPVLTPLPQPIEVQVLAADDRPVSDYRLTFYTADVGGRLSATGRFDDADSIATAATDAQGTARIYWRLGRKAGLQRLQIDAGAVAGPPLIVEAQARSGPPALLLKLSGDRQTAVVGRRLPQPLQVRVVDAATNPVADCAVRFVSQAAGGSFDGAPETVLKTNDGGEAAAFYTLGTKAGGQTIAAAIVSGIAGSPAEFEAIALPASAAYLTAYAGDGQRGVVNRLLPQPLTVQVTDAYGNGTADYPVTFSVVEGDGLADGERSISVRTAENGLAAVTFRLGRTAGRQRVRAEAAGLIPPSVDFVAEAAADAPHRLLYVSGSGQTGAPGTVLADSFLVRVTDAFSNPVAGQPVDFSVISPEGSLDGKRRLSVAADARGVAGTLLTLGTSTGDSIYIVEAASFHDGTPLEEPVRFYASAAQLPPHRLVAHSPLQLVGAPFRDMPQPVEVKVQDRVGRPVVDFPVQFTITQGSGALGDSAEKQAVRLTAPDGIASIRWTLGALNEPQRLTAAAAFAGKPLEGSPVSFSARTEAPFAASMQPLSSTASSCRPDDRIRLAVRILDQFGVPCRGRPVTFSILSGDAAFVDTTAPSAAVESDVDGTAAVELRFGLRPAQVSARCLKEDGTDVTGSPLYFTVVPAAKRLLLVEGDGLQAPVTSELEPLCVRAVDENGEAAAGIAVKFTRLVGDGNFIGDSLAVTADDGSAKVRYRFGEKSGLHRIVARAVGFQEAMLTLRALPQKAVRLRIAGGNHSTGVAGHALNQKLYVQALDPFANGVPEVSVRFSPQSNCGTVEPAEALTDSIGVAGTTWRLGLTEGDQVLHAAAEGLTPPYLIFQAQALPNQPPTLVLPDSAVVDENQLLSLSVSAADVEGDSVLLSSANLPPGAVFNEKNGEFNWRPTFEQAGLWRPVFYAADHLGAVSLRILPIRVRNVNRPPIISDEASRPRERDLIVREPFIDFTVVAADPDGDSLRFVWKIDGRAAAIGRSFRLSTSRLAASAVVEALVFDAEDTARTQWRLRLASAVEVTSLSAGYEPFVGVTLLWKASGSSAFVVERASADGRFETVGCDILPSEGGLYRFCDADVVAGERYSYRLAVITGEGLFIPKETVRIEIPLPQKPTMRPPLPNPFNSSVSLRLELPKRTTVRITVRDLLGRCCRRLAEETLEAGFHTLKWDGCDDDGRPVASGLYFVIVESGDGPPLRQKLTLLH